MRGRLQHFLRRYWLALAIPAAFFAMWGLLWAVHPTRVGIVTALMAPDLFVDLPASPLRLVGEEPLREEVWLDAPGGPLVADVYRPRGGGQRGAMLISVGAAPRIRDHPAVVRLSKAAARSGMVVMIPELYYPFRETGPVEDVQGLVDALEGNVEKVVVSFQWLREQPYVDRERMGMLGASVGGGIALVAAADPRIRGDVSFLTTLGTYYDLADLIGAIITRSSSYQGRREPWDPWDKSVRVLSRILISYLPGDADRDILLRIFVQGDRWARQEVGRLTPQGRQVYEAFQSGDIDQLFDIWSELSPHDRSNLRRVSPSSYVARLEAKTFILTDRSDPYIPYVESRRLRDALAQNGVELHYAEFDILNHVEPTSPANPFLFLADLFKLVFYAWLVLLRVL